MISERDAKRAICVGGSTCSRLLAPSNSFPVSRSSSRVSNSKSKIGDAIVKLHSAQLGTSTVSTLKPSLPRSSFPPQKKKKPTVIGKSQPAWAGCNRKIAALSATALIGYGHCNSSVTCQKLFSARCKPQSFQSDCLWNVFPHFSVFLWHFRSQKLIHFAMETLDAFFLWFISGFDEIARKWLSWQSNGIVTSCDSGH